MRLEILALILFAGIAMCVAEDLSDKDLHDFLDYLESIEQDKLQEAKNYQSKSPLHKRQPCVINENCPLGQNCLNMTEILELVLERYNSLPTFFYVQNFLSIDGYECVGNVNDWFMKNVTRFLPGVRQNYEHVQHFLQKTMDEEHLVGMEPFTKVSIDIEKPFTRSSQYDFYATAPDSDPLTAMLPLLLVLGEDSELEQLLPILMSSEDGGLNNPLLLLSLLSGESNDLDGILPRLLYSGLFGESSGIGSVLPLFLIEMLDGEGSMSDVLPLLLLTSSFAGTEGGPGDGFLTLLPLIILMTGDDEIGPIETFLLISTMGQGSSGISELLPLMLLFGNDEGRSGGPDLIYIIMLLGVLGQDTSSILPLMLFSDGMGAGDDTLKMLVIILSLSGLGGAKTDIGSLLPLLLVMGESNSNLTDILILTMLSQDNTGRSGDLLDMLLPLLSGGLENLDDMLPILMLLMNMDSTMGGSYYLIFVLMAMGGMEGNGDMDITTLLIITMMMGQEAIF